MSYFVSEVSSNHFRDLKRCFDFIDVSAAIGCDAVKFQLFKIEELFSREALQKKSQLLDRKKWELPVSFLPDLYNRCLEKKIGFSCTPFYLKAVEELYPYVESYKVASYELLWKDLLIECAKTGKPVVIAAGMATLDEVAGAVNTLKQNNCKDITVLHCVSSYPVAFNDCNLKAIDTIRDTLNVKVGWSDHSVDPAVIYRAVHKYSASMIEFHLDLEGEGAEFASGHCWLPDGISEVINNVRHGYLADGDGVKMPVPSELPDVDWRADPVDGLRPLSKIRNLI
jgi:N-acetylneuraminate synthase